jgi:hypothetical protein
VKVSLRLCVYLLATCIHLVGCGDPASSARDNAQTNSAPENGLLASGGGSAATPAAAGNDKLERSTRTECPDPCAEQTSCGQICLTLKGAGSNCQLVPTLNDLTRPPRSVHFDCSQLELGPNGYDFDALGHITLTGDTCEALQRGGPHRVALVLGCPP